MSKELKSCTIIPLIVCVFILLYVRPVAAVYEGFTAETGEFPWFVNLSGCGGVLVDAEWVLTARHCISDDAGLVASVRGNDDTPRTATIVRALRYDATRPDTLNDIALVQIAPPLTDIQPVALPTQHDWENANASDQLLVVGNGRTRSNYVLRTILPEMDDETADRYVDWYKLAHDRDATVHRYNDGLSIRPFPIYGSAYPTTLHVGRKQAWLSDLESPGGTCFGDSGGGLIHSRENDDGTITPVVMGITSSIDYCKSMAIRALFETDADGDDAHHTLPNNVTIPFPSWYDQQVDAGTFGYTQYTNVINPIWFNGFLLCNLPQLSSAKRQTMIRGQFTSDTIDPTQFGKIMTWTAVELIGSDGIEVCVTAPEHDGTFTMYLPSNYEQSDMQLKIQSRLFFDPEQLEPLGTTVIVPPTLLQSPYKTETFDLTAEHTHHVRPISITIIESEPYGFPATTYTTLLEQPLITTESVPDYYTIFVPAILFQPDASSNRWR